MLLLMRQISYGIRDEGWKVDFKKLFKYLKERYKCQKMYYFAGLDKYNKKQQAFYKRLEKFGFELVLKAVKLYRQRYGKTIRKANCDLDLTFYAMRDKEKYKRAIFLTGDRDFEVLLKYLVKERKEVIVLANAKRTAREIKQVRGIQFNDFGSLKKTLFLAKK